MARGRVRCTFRWMCIEREGKDTEKTYRVRERERGACFWNKYEENFKSHKTVARWLKQVR